MRPIRLVQVAVNGILIMLWAFAAYRCSCCWVYRYHKVPWDTVVPSSSVYSLIQLAARLSLRAGPLVAERGIRLFGDNVFS